MKRQLQGIALILIGIQITLVCIIDPWIPMIGDVGRAMSVLIQAWARSTSMLTAAGFWRGS